MHVRFEVMKVFLDPGHGCVVLCTPRTCSYFEHNSHTIKCNCVMCELFAHKSFKIIGDNLKKDT